MGITTFAIFLMIPIAIFKLKRLFENTSGMLIQKLYFSACIVGSVTRGTDMFILTFIDSSLSPTDEPPLIAVIAQVCFEFMILLLILSCIDLYYTRHHISVSKRKRAIVYVGVIFVVSYTIITWLHFAKYKTARLTGSVLANLTISGGVISLSRKILHLETPGSSIYLLSRRMYNVNLVVCSTILIRIVFIVLSASEGFDPSVSTFMYVYTLYIWISELLPDYLLLLWVFVPPPRRSDFANQKLTEVVLLDNPQD